MFVTRIPAPAARCQLRYLPPSATPIVRLSEDHRRIVEEQTTLVVCDAPEPSERGHERKTMDELCGCPAQTRPCVASVTAPREGPG